jgi:hypothetical protein
MRIRWKSNGGGIWVHSKGHYGTWSVFISLGDGIVRLLLHTLAFKADSRLHGWAATADVRINAGLGWTGLGDLCM